MKKLLLLALMLSVFGLCACSDEEKAASEPPKKTLKGGYIGDPPAVEQPKQKKLSGGYM